MKKSTQLKINENVLEAWDEAKEALERDYPSSVEWKRLRSCTAEVYDGTRFVYLRSDNTIVAFIDKKIDSNCVYDVLRYVYGYTSTSAKHIAKFTNDYAGIKYGFRRTYYPV